MAYRYTAEIDDVSVEHAVDLALEEFVFVAIGLIDKNRDEAAAYIDSRRQTSLDRIKNIVAIGGEFRSIDEEGKVGRIAVALLDRAFDRLTNFINLPDDDDPPAEQPED